MDQEALVVDAEELDDPDDAVDEEVAEVDELEELPESDDDAGSEDEPPERESVR